MSEHKANYNYVAANVCVESQTMRTGLCAAGGTAATVCLNSTERVVLRAGGFLNPGDKVKPRRVEQGG